MKYGDTLQQRSIAAWQTHNIDYQDIKHFIKINTTPGKGKAVCIPGQTDTNAEVFEKRLFAILEEQDERITWFVKSKVGEIQRRLAHLEQQIEKYTNRTSDPQGRRTTIRRLERYGKAETDILKVGEEIQALSRFIGVQQEAFRKLIKKHKKWTGSTELGYRFDVEVRQQRSSFADTDLKPLLQRYEQLLHSVRALHQHDKPDPSNPLKSLRYEAPSATKRLEHTRFTLEEGKRVDFDNLLATLRADDTGQDAVFWVHPENIVELQILLQHYMRSFNISCRRTSTASNSSTPTSPTGLPAHSSQLDTFDIVADNAQIYLTARASENVNESQLRFDKAALHARAVLNDDVSLLTWALDPRASSTETQTCALKRKFVQSVLDPTREILPRKACVPHISVDGASDRPEQSIENLQKWLKQHSEISPIAAIISQRSRYYNLQENTSGLAIAALDQSIQFQSGISSQPNAAASEFPFAVLTIREQGANSVDLIKILDKCHLVERVHGFSLEYHAVWQAKQPEGISPPFWIPLLKQDLRKVPQTPRKALRKESTEFGSQSTTPRASTAASSDAGGQTDASKADDLRKLRFATIAESPGRKSLIQKPRHVRGTTTTERYWNEYDEPSEDEDQYVIYIDPNYESVWDKAWKSFLKVLGLKEEKSPENEPLLYSPDLEPGSFDEAESSDDELETQFHRTARVNGHSRVSPRLKVQSADSLDIMPRLTLACFSSSFAILVVAFILATTGKKKLHTEVDAGVIFAVVTSLTFAVIGVGNLYRSRAHIRILVWLIAGIALCIVGIASGGLLAWLLA
ncbi:hypothetical protein K461DRAFT_77199 [Myriangium duriaei CBS 260.36]|uniref:SPX domain-containing protein n=1 Tax=Myriangium duriaei CBS 260.36 TaxID=1168546 RepID=A0A9P4J8W0_9PEZI|nr:hypothetical protein K461DRAFT_77199 [Myriangium duriaei CBS 260.36]